MGSGDQDPLMERLVQAMYSFAAEQMKNGISSQQIQSMLIDKGLDRESAATVVSNIVRRSEAFRQVARKNMIHGGLWCIGGAVVTAASYSAASGGGRYIVAWGAIAFGALQFFRGLKQFYGGF